MKVTVEKQENYVAVINLDIEAESAALEYGKACKRLGQRINVPGFRRGKVPRPVIEKTVGIDRIKQEALDRLLPHLFADVISEHQLDVVAPPSIENYKFDLSEGIQVKAQVELRPEVTLPALDGLKVEVPRYVVPEGSEESEIRGLVTRMTTLEPVIDRASIETDIVTIDFTGTVHGELIRGGSAKNYRLDLTDNNFIDGFAQQLVGHRIGEEFMIKVTFPKDYQDASLAGKQADFLVRLNDILQKVVPELSDELARKVGPYNSVDELKKAVRDGLKANEDRENDNRKQAALIESLIGQSDIQVPDPMINREAKIILEEVKQRFKSQGLSWDQYLDAQGHEGVWENFRKEALKRIKTSLIVGAIAKQEQVAVTDEDFSNYIQELTQQRNADDKALMRQLANSPYALQALNDLLLSQKVMAFLMEKASFELVDAPAKPEDATTEPEAEFEVLQDE